MFYSDDPIRDFHRHDAEMQIKVLQLPHCADCGNHIDEDYYYRVDDDVLCESCLNGRYRYHTDDYSD